MPTGFAQTTQKADHCISSLIKNIKKTYPNCVEENREWWNKSYVNRNPQISLDKLLNPEHSELDISKNPERKAVRASHKNIKTHWDIEKGLWQITAAEDRGMLTFTICALVGDVWRFHPQAIESHIVRNYGRVVYDQWKAELLEDIDSLKVIVEEARKRINKTYWSVTCCERSTRLCKRVGIPVRSGIAFLFPSKVDTNGL